MKGYQITRHLLILGLVGASLGVSAQPSWAQSPEEVRATIRAEAAPYGNAEHVIRVVSCETGGSYAASSIGDGGTSFGIGQLHRGGLLDSGPSSFYGQGFTDPFDATQAARYMAWAFANGLASHWSCR